MAAAALLNFAAAGAKDPPLAELLLTPRLLAVLRGYQLRQFHPGMVLAIVRDWVASGAGGRSVSSVGFVWWGRAPTRISSASDRLPTGGSSPASRGRTPSCLTGFEEGRVYVYDPNYPRARERYVEFRRDGLEFAYGGFRSWEGWGITLTPPLRL